MAWQENSIMASKGVAKGKRGIHHMITEADQGKYHYVYGPYVKPVLTVDPGAVVSADVPGSVVTKTDCRESMRSRAGVSPTAPDGRLRRWSDVPPTARMRSVDGAPRPARRTPPRAPGPPVAASDWPRLPARKLECLHR